MANPKPKSKNKVRKERSGCNLMCANTANDSHVRNCAMRVFTYRNAPKASAKIIRY